MATNTGYIEFNEQTVPATPAAGKQRLYIDSATHAYKTVNSSGTSSAIGGGSGSVATDTIWDAKGDLAAGTGADTAAKLTVGTNYKRLVADSSQSTGLLWQGFIGARATNTAGTTMTDATETVVPYATEDFDTATIHDTSTNNSRLTVPTGYGGYWRFTANAVVGSATYTSVYLVLRLNANATAGAGTALAFGRPGTPSSTITGLNLSTVVSLAAADYVELFVHQVSGAGRALSTTVGYNWLAAEFLGV